MTDHIGHERGHGAFRFHEFGDDDGGNGPETNAEHGKPVTFDQFLVTNYLHANNNADGSQTETQILRIDGFALGGSPVNPPGFGDHYGMYFLIEGTGHQAAPGAPVTFDTQNIALMVDPGNNDGALSSTELGIGFANGTQGDFALFTGTLVSASVAFDASGAHANFIEQLTMTEEGREAFGGTIDTGALLHELLNATRGPDIYDLGGGNRISVVNGWGGGVAELSPLAPMTLRPGQLTHDEGSSHGGIFAGAFH